MRQIAITECPIFFTKLFDLFANLCKKDVIDSLSFFDYSTAIWAVSVFGEVSYHHLCPYLVHSKSSLFELELQPFAAAINCLTKQNFDWIVFVWCLYHLTCFLGGLMAGKSQSNVYRGHILLTTSFFSDLGSWVVEIFHQHFFSSSQ